MRNRDEEHDKTLAAEDELTVGVDRSDGSASGRLAEGVVLSRRYRIDAYIAAGGMGAVHLAHDLDLGVPLALKTIRPEIAGAPATLRRFKQEVLLARSVAHPNVCRVFDIGRDEPTGVSYLTMEYLEGHTLSSYLREQGALAPESALPLVRQLADALDAAHQAGVIHRDFKCANIMLVPRGESLRAVITDFGLAVPHVDSGEVMTASGDPVPRGDSFSRGGAPLQGSPTLHEDDPPRGRMVGTPAYMSPEQVMGRNVGPASDLYALGVVLFEMCTGHVPFRRDTAVDTARAHLQEAPPTPSSLTEVEPVWEAAILRLLSKEPGARFETAAAVVRVLEGAEARAEGPTHSLPAERDEFVGRGTELDAISTNLFRTGTRLLTLLGPGGTGKTRLVVRYGWKELERWPGGVWFCDLSEAKTKEDVAVTVAASLGVRLDAEDPIDQLGAAIAAFPKALLILDNFEQVAHSAAGTIGVWLQRSRNLSVLVTSRERLGLDEESVQELDPLDPTTHGVELFALRASGHRPGFAIDETNQERVAEIVRDLDGLPLAIELAAARLRMLTLDQLSDRLEDRLRLLAGGKRGRHATLRATLDWSWDLLSDYEQSALAQMAVFEGGFSLEAAEAVIDLSAFEDAPLELDVLQGVIDKSWIRVTEFEGAPRFQVYKLVQAYLSEKLAKHQADPGRKEADTHIRHGRFFATMGSPEWLRGIDGPAGVAKRRELTVERDNLVTACRRAVERRDEETAAQTFAAIDRMVEATGPFQLLMELGQDVLPSLTDPHHRLKVMDGVGLALSILGHLDEAGRTLEDTIALARDLGDRTAEAGGVVSLAYVRNSQGDTTEARLLHERGLTLSREAGNGEVECRALHGLANFELTQGSMDVAFEHMNLGLEIARKLGNVRFEGSFLGLLGNLCVRQGRLEDAIPYLEDTARAHRAIGAPHLEAAALNNIAVALHEQGQQSEAEEYVKRAIAIHRKTGARLREALCLETLAAIRDRGGDRDGTREAIEASVALLRELDSPVALAKALSSLGSFESDLGNAQKAREILDEVEGLVGALPMEPELELQEDLEDLRRTVAERSGLDGDDGV